MKRIITSVSLAAVSATGLNAAYAPDIAPEAASKPWGVSAAVRGFYDDNVYMAAPDDPRGVQDSFGFQVMPSFSLNLPLDQTFIGVGYEYRLTYYDDRGGDPYDQEHIANLNFDHAFNSSHRISVSDRFVFSDEPSLYDAGDLVTDPTSRRTDSDVMHNRGEFSYLGEFGSRMGLGLDYRNSWYDYSQDGAGSRSALLDRMTHDITVDLRTRMKESMTGLVGYRLGVTQYLSNDNLSGGFIPLPGDQSQLQDPSIRDNYSHYAYLGVDTSLNSQMTAQIRAGAQITVYSEIPYQSSETYISPYVDASLSYAYSAGSSIQGGIRHMRNPTDIGYGFEPGATEVTDLLTLDQESTMVYAVVKQKLSSKLSANLLGSWQYSRFNGGVFDWEADNYYSLGLNLAYQVNHHLSVEAGYSFDRLDSDINYTSFLAPGDSVSRSFMRNRVYIGLRGSI